jgi:hypothetical protein
MYKVMIVDDEDIIVSGLVKVMPWAKYGCEVADTASDGLAAQAVLREKRPDILFTDICMPGADGLALLAAVRSEFPDMQVTILSGFRILNTPSGPSAWVWCGMYLSPARCMSWKRHWPSWWKTWAARRVRRGAVCGKCAEFHHKESGTVH